MKTATLEDYAHRRFALSGTSVVKSRYPYCEAVDVIGVSRTTQPGSVVSFAHYDYLGLADDPRIAHSAKSAVDEFGVGAGASRLVGGELSLHRMVERNLASFVGAEDALALVSGYATNVALIGHLLTKGDLVIADEAAHNSIIAGTQLSRADAMTFHHNDLDHLHEILQSHRERYGRALVVVEGLYSMDGDVPDLPLLIEICRRHNAWLMIDEAHSIGVLGDRGRGITEHFGVDPQEIDLIVGTLSKAFVSSGGFICAKHSIIEWLRYTLPGFVYSVGLSPPALAAANSALQILQAEPDRLKRVRDNSRYFLSAAQSRNLNVGRAVGAAVVPIMFRDTAIAIEVGLAALEAGYFVPPIVQIAVPKNAPRLRFFVTAAHTQSQMSSVLDVLQVGTRNKNVAPRCNAKSA